MCQRTLWEILKTVHRLRQLCKPISVLKLFSWDCLWRLSNLPSTGRSLTRITFRYTISVNSFRRRGAKRLGRVGVYLLTIVFCTSLFPSPKAPTFRFLAGQSRSGHVKDGCRCDANSTAPCCCKENIRYTENSSSHDDRFESAKPLNLLARLIRSDSYCGTATPRVSLAGDGASKDGGLKPKPKQRTHFPIPIIDGPRCDSNYFGLTMLPPFVAPECVGGQTIQYLTTDALTLVSRPEETILEIPVPPPRLHLATC